MLSCQSLHAPQKGMSKLRELTLLRGKRGTTQQIGAYICHGDMCADALLEAASTFIKNGSTDSPASSSEGDREDSQPLVDSEPGDEVARNTGSQRTTTPPESGVRVVPMDVAADPKPREGRRGKGRRNVRRKLGIPVAIRQGQAKENEAQHEQSKPSRVGRGTARVILSGKRGELPGAQFGQPKRTRL